MIPAKLIFDKPVPFPFKNKKEPLEVAFPLKRLVKSRTNEASLLPSLDMPGTSSTK